MMTEFIAKLTPTEGYIVEGDILINSKNQIRILYKGHDIYPDDKKAKLYLCNRATGEPILPISPGAIWVRDGDHFDHNDVIIGADYCPDQGISPESCVSTHKHIKVVSIKCDRCGIYH